MFPIISSTKIAQAVPLDQQSLNNISCWTTGPNLK